MGEAEVFELFYLIFHGQSVFFQATKDEANERTIVAEKRVVFMFLPWLEQSRFSSWGKHLSPQIAATAKSQTLPCPQQRATSYPEEATPNANASMR